MEKLFEPISYIISETLKILASVTTHLLSNYLFQIIIGMVFLSIIIALIFYMLSKTRTQNSNPLIIDTTKYGDMKYDDYNEKTGEVTAGYKGLKNGKVVWFEMKWNKYGQLTHDGSKNIDEFLW